MARVLLILVLTGVLAWGQGPQNAPSPATVEGKDPVITIHGVCPENKAGSSRPDACVTVVTREQFEEMMAAISISGQAYNPAAVRNIANQYVHNLALAAAAEKAGIDKDPRFQELMRVVRQSQLADAFHRQLEEQYRNPYEQEIAGYYQQHLSDFEQIKLRRIYIPAEGPGLVKTGPPGKPAVPPADAEAEHEKRAADIARDVRDRAARGENMDALQKEAYLKLGFASRPLSSDYGTHRRGSLNPDQEKGLFLLKAGEVSTVYRQPAGFAVYQVESHETVPLEQVRGEIARTLLQQHVEAALKSATEPVRAELNEQYFGAGAAPPPLLKMPGSASTKQSSPAAQSPEQPR